MNITAGTRKYQKIMITIIMMGPFTVSSIIFLSKNIPFKELSPEFTDSDFGDLYILWEGHESTCLIYLIQAGLILGSLFIPHLADLYGRKK